MNKIRITIDPGHDGINGNHNVGASGKYWEHIGMLQLSLMLREELLSTNAFEVCLTRDTNNIALSLLDRAKIARDFKSSMFISEHSNAGGGTTGSGSEALFSLKCPQDKILGEQFASEIAKTLGIVSRGAKTRESGSSKGYDYYGILRYGTSYGIPHVFIIESAFHSNPKEEAMLLDPNIMRKIAQAQARVICGFYKVQYPAKQITTPQPPYKMTLSLIVKTPEAICYSQPDVMSPVVKTFKNLDKLTAINISSDGLWYQLTIGWIQKVNFEVEKPKTKYTALEVLVDVLNCRTAPNMSSNVIRTYKKADKLTALGIPQNNFWQILLNGKPAYVSSNPKHTKVLNEFYK
jgi:N-acetylmuramoyl-L-alanine amidase